jgi:hypothetical protein
MAKSLDKKKPKSSLYEYGDKQINFYGNAAVRNQLVNQALINQVNHTYYHSQEKTSFKKNSKSGKKTGNRIMDGPQNVYCTNASPSQPRFNSINRKAIQGNRFTNNQSSNSLSRKSSSVRNYRGRKFTVQAEAEAKQKYFGNTRTGAMNDRLNGQNAYRHIGKI